MIEHANFIFELGVEELPAKGLTPLAEALAKGFNNFLTASGLTFNHIQTFATPRRLSVFISALSAQQPEQTIRRKGPSLAAAFDAQSHPTPAALGFARSCGVDIEALSQEEGSLVYQHISSGQKTIVLLPSLIQQVLNDLALPKIMRWGSSTHAFLRPVRWLVMLYGDSVVSGELFGLTSAAISYGHRFHAPQPLNLLHADNYLTLLEQQGFVIADFAKRRALIQQQIQQQALALNAAPIISDALLDEVTGQTEWPVALLCRFDAAFLSVPQEAIISAMQEHQQCFGLLDVQGKLLPHFIAISNIESADPQKVITGNERVMQARLSDAAFFYQQDCQRALQHWLEGLKQVTFQTKLGSLYAKSVRIAKLAAFIAEKIKTDAKAAEHAGLLAKADLLSSMVGEFPELQGIMGYYYALHNGETLPVATAIREHYLPRFAGDQLPKSAIGCAVALADRLDTLVGLFGINQPPTGDKDPFGLRRATLGIIRIIIEHQLDLDITELLQQALQAYTDQLPGAKVIESALDFINERLRIWLQEQKLATTDSFAAVSAVQNREPYDIYLRLQAINKFRQLPEASALAAANKRVSNLLAKNTLNLKLDLQEQWLESEAEHKLMLAVKDKIQETMPLLNERQYTEALISLAELNHPITRFFDEVMVMVEDERLRNNRLALLASIRALFMHIADISLLQIQ